MKKIIADFLCSGVGISLEEFKKCLEEEIEKVSKEMINLILNEIKRAIKKYSSLPGKAALVKQG